MRIFTKPAGCLLYTSMLNVDNRKAVSLLSRRSLRAGRLRNMMAVLAIALTAILFTSLFTIGGSMIDSMEYSTMRQVGTQSHGGFKYLTQQQYDTLAQDPEIKDISYNIIAGFAADVYKRQHWRHSFALLNIIADPHRLRFALWPLLWRLTYPSQRSRKGPLWN